MYSPMTPRQTSWMPPIRQTMQTVLAQPATVLPISAPMTAHTTPMKLRMLNSIPMPVMSRMGLLDRLVMPSKARASILDRG